MGYFGEYGIFGDISLDNVFKPETLYKALFLAQFQMLYLFSYSLFLFAMFLILHRQIPLTNVKIQLTSKTKLTSTVNLPESNSLDNSS